MAIAYRTLVKNQTPADPCAVNPSATALDVIIAAFTADAITSGTWTLPTSFDNLATAAMTPDAQYTVVGRKKSASGSEGSLNTSVSGGISVMGAMVSFSGVNNTTPEDVAVDVVTVDSAGSSAWTVDSNSITPTTAGAKIVAIMFDDITDSGTVVHSFSTVSGSTGSWTVHDASITNGGFSNIGIASCDWTSGSVVVRGTGTCASRSAARTLVTIVLKPVGGPTYTLMGRRYFILP